MNSRFDKSTQKSTDNKPAGDINLKVGDELPDPYPGDDITDFYEWDEKSNKYVFNQKFFDDIQM